MNTKYSFIKTPNFKLALMKVAALKPGPTIWLTGAAHGDEVGGILIIQELFKRLQQKPLLKGAIYALPLLNPAGFETVSRGIGKSNEDLNRSFPGKANGTSAEILANTIFTQIRKTNPAIVLDIHNDWLNTIPYIEIDPNPGQKNKTAYDQAKLYAFKLGFPIINELEQAALAQNLQKTLSGSLLLHNIPALTLEIGGSSTVSSVFKEEDLKDGVKAIWDLLTYLGMVKPQKQKFHSRVSAKFKGKILKYSHQPDASKSGIVKYLVKPGAVVKKGQPVANIINVFGQVQETLCAEKDSLLLGHSDFSVAYPGAELISFGIL